MDTRNRVRKVVLLLPVFIVGFAVFVTVGGFLVRWLWNWLLPPLFGWHTITFWQALGILALCRILFGGLGLHNSGRSRFRRRMEERWGHMSPEDREQFRQRMREHFGFERPPGETGAPRGPAT